MKCMYCGKDIKINESHNPEDFGLHTPYLDFSNKRTCNDCNALVTIPNRLIKGVLDTNYSEHSLDKLDSYIKLLREEIIKKF